MTDEEIDILLSSEDIYYLVDDEEPPNETGIQTMQDVDRPMGIGVSNALTVGKDGAMLTFPEPPTRRRRRLVPAIAAVALCSIVLALVLQSTLMVNSTTGNQPSSATMLTYDWVYNGVSYSITVNISGSSFDYYAGQDIARGLSSPPDYDLTKDFVTTGDSTITEIADMLEGIAASAGMSEHELLSFTLAFVQYIPYSDDLTTYGIDEYWAYPVETLYHQTGDCEDKSFVYASLVEAMGADAVLLIYTNHVAVGVDDSGASGTYYSLNGVKYYYSETTEVGWEIGDTLPAGYNSAHVVDV